MKALTFRAPNIIHVSFLGFVFWFTTDLVSFVFRSGGPPPVVSYVLFLTFSVAAFILHVALGRSHSVIVPWRKARLFWLFSVCFLGWSLINFLYSSQSEVALQSLITRVEMILILLAFFWFLSSQCFNRSIGLMMVAVAVLGAFLNIIDFLYPQFSSVYGRAAGLYQNPNSSGLILTLALSSGIAFLPIFLRWPFLIFVFLGVFFTFSRGSWLVFGASLVWFAWRGFLGQRAMRFLIFGFAVFGALLFVTTMLQGALVSWIIASPIGAYLDANTIARLGGSGFATDDSASERRAVAQLAISAFLDGRNPLFGYGLGHTYEWEMAVSTHNMYLLFLVEGGILGLVIYIWLLGVLWRCASGVGRLVVFQIFAFSFFDHNVLDSPARIFFLALVAACVLNLSSKGGSACGGIDSVGNTRARHYWT